jgi:hypothetical protein
MNLKYLFSAMVPTNKIIKNIEFPSCKNCIYYKPNIVNNDFTSIFNKCEKFGEKNIITGKIEYNFVDLCRNDETKCGKEGKYFEEEKNIKLKVFRYKIISNLPLSLPILIIAINLFIKILFGK